MTNDAETETVARAIAPKAWAAYGLIGRDSLAQESRRTASMRHAQIAISALRAHDAARGLVTVPRVPTEGMLKACKGALKPHCDAMPEAEKLKAMGRTGGYLVNWRDKAIVRYQAMIAAAETSGG